MRLDVLQRRIADLLRAAIARGVARGSFRVACGAASRYLVPNLYGVFHCTYRLQRDETADWFSSDRQEAEKAVVIKTF